ncbi:hypothetical protein [Polluticaenibacter yanchengensis]|uniref:Uncharacterized protein n=1 Tax=Polluticaenibacter yanchengensis TaxID=3014562 RepID=A0ABT4UJ21_9BACT|nr:hypothetical protein [Chitinophagaceae bacterium LY-5]
MKHYLMFLFLTIATIANSQTQKDVDNFIAILQKEIKNYNIGNIEEHYEKCYFKTLSESDFLDKNMEVSIINMFKSSFQKTENETKKIIKDYFEQLKRLKNQKNEIDKNKSDYSFMKSYLKIRVYSATSEDLYKKNNAIIRPGLNGIIEVVVFDLPDGIGSLNKNETKNWNKSEEEIYAQAKENTMNFLDQTFEFANNLPTGEKIYLLASDSNLFITSYILDLKKSKITVGKFGTIVSIPNNSVVVAMPIDDKDKLLSSTQNFFGLTEYMYESNETKPLCNKIY